MDFKYKTKYDYTQKGKQLFEENCSSRNEHPLLFPDVDVARQSEESINGRLRKLYIESEANKSNLKIYQALKGLHQPLIVLLDLHYNHNQFQNMTL